MKACDRISKQFMNINIQESHRASPVDPLLACVQSPALGPSTQPADPSTDTTASFAYSFFNSADTPPPSPGGSGPTSSSTSSSSPPEQATSPEASSADTTASFAYSFFNSTDTPPASPGGSSSPTSSSTSSTSTLAAGAATRKRKHATGDATDGPSPEEPLLSPSRKKMNSGNAPPLPQPSHLSSSSSSSSSLGLIAVPRALAPFSHSRSITPSSTFIFPPGSVPSPSSSSSSSSPSKTALSQTASLFSISPSSSSASSTPPLPSNTIPGLLRAPYSSGFMDALFPKPALKKNKTSVISSLSPFLMHLPKDMSPSQLAQLYGRGSFLLHEGKTIVILDHLINDPPNVKAANINGQIGELTVSFKDLRTPQIHGAFYLVSFQTAGPRASYAIFKVNSFLSLSRTSNTRYSIFVAPKEQCGLGFCLRTSASHLNSSCLANDINSLSPDKFIFLGFENVDVYKRIKEIVDIFT